MSNNQQWFRKDTKHLVHDPNNSLVTGDVIELHAEQHTKHVAYVVGAIVSPFGKPIEERPPVPTADDRLAAYKEKRFAKYKRRAERAVQVPKLRAAADAGDKVARIKLDQILAMQSGIPQKRDPASTGTKSKTAA
jgi:small subunit ribosomal protein S17